MALVKVLSKPPGSPPVKLRDSIAFQLCKEQPTMYELVSPPKVTVEVLQTHIVTDDLPKKKEDAAEDKQVNEAVNSMAETAPAPPKKRRKRKKR